MSHRTRSVSRVRPVVAAVALLSALTVPATAQEAPPPITLLPGSVSPAVITAGDPAVQTINISRPAPPGGQRVSLSGGNDSVYRSTAPNSTRVPEGETSVSFPIRVDTRHPTTFVRPLFAQVAESGRTRVAEVTILPADPAVRAVTALRGPDTVLSGTQTTLTGELRIPAPPGGLVVDLTGSGSGGGHGVTLISRDAVFTGGSSSTTVSVLPGAKLVPTVVRATLLFGTSEAVWETIVVPDDFAIRADLTARGTVGEGVVGIGSAPNPSGIRVALQSDTPGVAVPDTVTIPPGDHGARYPIGVDAGVEVDSAMISATWSGRSTSGRLTIEGPIDRGPEPTPEPTPTPDAEPDPGPTRLRSLSPLPCVAGTSAAGTRPGRRTPTGASCRSTGCSPAATPRRARTCGASCPDPAPTWGRSP